MPYIIHERREQVSESGLPENAGELNWVLTMVIKGYLQNKGTCYQTMNDIVGALESCKAEFQRRVVNPYEDEKIKLNGDVYD
ncbi:MAG: hypothetical protein LUQ65_02090 [Candidatus Helarchaeota archaeon]|nr:hypothetical protein [Candidatus Helarchaeota archaeon]